MDTGHTKKRKKRAIISTTNIPARRASPPSRRTNSANPPAQPSRTWMRSCPCATVMVNQATAPKQNSQNSRSHRPPMTRARMRDASARSAQ